MLEQEADAYAEHGVVCLRKAIDRHWVDLLTDDLATAELAPSPFAVDLAGGRSGEEATKSSYWGDFSLWERHPGYRKFILDSPLAQIVASVTRGRLVQLFYDYLLVKQASEEGDGQLRSATAWHQDYPYYPVEGTDICSVFVPLQPTSLENGGLEYVLGSHKWGPCLDKSAFPEVKGRLSAEKLAELEAWEAKMRDLPAIDADRAAYDIRSWDLAPGDILIHHCLAVHGAPPNRARAERAAYAIRWIYGDVTYSPRANPTRHLDALMSDPSHPIAPAERPAGPHFPTLYRQPL